MALFTVEGVVKDGVIRLRDDIRLPEHATVFVVVPEASSGSARSIHIRSPRLANPTQAGQLVKTVIDLLPNADPSRAL